MLEKNNTLSMNNAISLIFISRFVLKLYKNYDLKSKEDIGMDEIMIQTKYKGASVYQSKPLIEACKRFDINEGRLFYLGLLELRPQLAHGKGQEKFTEVVIPTTDVIKLFGGNPGYYSKLKNVAKKLIDRSIAVRDDDNEQTFKYISIFDMLHFDKKLGGLHVKFNDTMRPYILELADKPYTKIAVKTIFALNSHYAIRLMELMLEYQNIVEFKRNKRIKRKIMIEDLRFYCGIDEKKYNTTTNFTQNVVARPCKEINSSTPYELSYVYVKKGRLIVGYDFTLKLPETNDNVETIEELVESNQKVKIQKAVNSVDVNFKDDNISIYAILLSYGIGKIVAKRLIKKYDEDRIFNNIEYVKHRKNIKNLAAYLRKAIEEDYYSEKNVENVKYSSDIIKTADDNIEKELTNLGFGPIASNLLKEAVKNGRFNITERNMCKGAGIEPDSLFEAIKNNDFSTLEMEEESNIDVIDIKETEESIIDEDERQNQNIEEFFINTILLGEQVSIDFVKKAARLGINLAEIAATLGMSIKECIKIK